MKNYRHTQIGYLIILITIGALVFFSWVQILARLEPPSVDSGANFAITSIMIFILFILASFSTLTVTVDEHYLKIKFGWGIYHKKFLLTEIATAKKVKNQWYLGWGIRLWFWPKMWIYNISGFDAIELAMRNGRTYRIGTDDSEKLELAISQKTGPY